MVIRSKILIFSLFVFSNTIVTGQGAYTLESCETSLGNNIPTFFQKYFQCVDIKLSESGQYVNLYYKGKAPYESWYYEDGHPNHIDWYSQGQGYFLIPNAYIIENDYVISIPINPDPRPGLVIDGDAVDGNVGNNNYEYPMGSVGSALNGVNMFNPCASPPDVIEDEAYCFDLYNAHPAGPSGIYHYHTNSSGPLEVLEYKGLITNTTPGTGEVEVFGIMCDGVLVLGCTELDGSAPNESDWDAQNGHVHNMVDEEGVLHFTDRYHTHICYDEITENDTDGNGYQEHEFTPEISYYKTPGMGQSYDRCGAMSEPFEPDGELAVDFAAISTFFSLYKNYPNPFNPITSLRYNLPEEVQVILTVYDLMGREVTQLVNTAQEAGYKSVQWDATDNFGNPVSAGIYLYQIRAGEFVQTKKMVLLK